MKLYYISRRFAPLFVFSSLIIGTCSPTLGKPLRDSSAALPENDIRENGEANGNITGSKFQNTEQPGKVYNENTKSKEIEPQTDLTINTNKTGKQDFMSIRVYSRNLGDPYYSDDSSPWPIILIVVGVTIAILSCCIRLLLSCSGDGNRTAERQRQYRIVITDTPTLQQRLRTQLTNRLIAAAILSRLMSNRLEENASLANNQEEDLPPAYSTVVNENEDMDSTIQSPTATVPSE